MATHGSIDAGSLAIITVVGGRWKQNAYVIIDAQAQEALIVDPGAEPSVLLRAVWPNRLIATICTHGHYDHLGAAAEIAKLTGAPCRVHERDMALALQAPNYSLAFERRRLELPARIEAFEDSEAFAVGRHVVDILPCPGHTPGSVAFRLEETVFCGDTILQNKIGRVDLPGGDGQVLGRSIDQLLGSFQENTVLLPGHGAPWTVGEARRWWKARTEVTS